MHSRRIVFSAIALSVIFLGASLSSGAAARAATGTLSMSWATGGAEQNLGVRLIAVNRRGGSVGAASVLCTTVNGTAVAGKDFTAVNRVVTWASGDAADKWCNVTISDAIPFTGQKTFYVKLSNPTGAPLGASTTTKVTIYGNKGGGLVSLSAATYTTAQNAGSVKITVNRTGGSSGGASVSYATANSTAIAGTNYTSERSSLSWGNGDAAPKTFVIPISNATPFSGTKSFAVALSAPSAGGAISSPGTATVAIAGDASMPVGTLMLSTASNSVAQNAGSVTVTVDRTGGSSGAVAVTYGEVNGSAVAGTDYTATSGTLTITDGTMKVTVTLLGQYVAAGFHKAGDGAGVIWKRLLRGASYRL